MIEYRRIAHGKLESLGIELYASTNRKSSLERHNAAVRNDKAITLSIAS